MYGIGYRTCEQATTQLKFLINLPKKKQKLLMCFLGKTKKGALIVLSQKFKSLI